MTCPSCYNTSCPEAVSEVTISQTLLQLADGDAAVVVESFNVAGTQVTLTATPISGYTPKVWVNGVLQKATTHYSISGTTVTFTFTLALTDDVQVEYAYEV